MAADSTQSFRDGWDRASRFFRGLSLPQRLLIASGTVLVAATLWVFVALLGQPKYVTLYSGLRPEEAQALGGRLAAKNIPHQISPDGGSVLVPEDKLDASRLETAASGLPRSARLGFELFDTPNWAGSDFTEKVNYQRALEGELERTLATLSEVEAVRVHLVMPQESLFTEQQREAKAAVILKTRSGRLSEQAQQAIPQLVASAVDRLRPENVTLVDADNNTPLLHNRDGGTGRTIYSLDEELARTLVHTLEPVVGPEHVRASVHVEYDMGTSEDSQETYDPKTTATLTQQHAEETSSGGAPAGIPGTASNVPASTAAPAAPPPAAAAPGAAPGTPPPGTTSSAASGAASAVGPASEQSSSRSDSTTFAVSKTMHHSVEPPGRLRRIAAAVLVDDAVEVTESAGKRTTTRRKRTVDEMKQIEQLARAAIGVDPQRGDVLAVENLSFQELPVEILVPPTRTERWRTTIEPWSWSLRYVGLAALFLVIYWMVLRPVKQQALAAFRQLPSRVSAQTTASGSAPPNLAEPASGADRTSQLKRLLTEKAQAEPAAVSRLVQTWVQQEEKTP
jgi:flagellar M-ring protein FliF